MRRRRFVQTLGAGSLALPLASTWSPRRARAANGTARRILFFYYPDGVVGPSADGDATKWHASGGEHDFSLSPLLAPLEDFADRCVFFNGLTMGATDSGSHPGGAKKLLTATDGGNGISIDQHLAGTVGADMPFRHVYLGAMANEAGASGDKHISYPSPGVSTSPQDDPGAAFDFLFGQVQPGGDFEPDPRKVTVIDAILDDMDRLRGQLGAVESAKLDLHLEALREVEDRIKSVGMLSCEDPSVAMPDLGNGLYDPAAFPDILRAQSEIMVLAMACGLTRVGRLQASHHTSELIMSRFEGTEMYDPDFDMRSHQASHYGPTHDMSKPEYAAYFQQRRWWVEQYASVLELMDALPEPEGDGTMLDNSLVLLCTEVCDGNTHLHDEMPFVLAGEGGGAVNPGRLLSHPGRRHADLLIALANAMGDPLESFGDNSGGALPGLLR